MSVRPEESARFLREREARRHRGLDGRFAAMRRDAEHIVAAIAERFRPQRIYQWGSLLDRSRFRSYSDIDIAVSGITDAKTWQQVEKLAWDRTDFPLDLVQFEHVEPEYAELIRERGRVVYERSS